MTLMIAIFGIARRRYIVLVNHIHITFIRKLQQE